MGVASLITDSLVEYIHTLVSEATDSILVIPYPSLDANLSLYPLPSTRILAAYGDGRELPMPKSLHGRSPLIVIAFPKEFILEAKSAASRFVDYSADEWESHESGDWFFLKTKQPLAH